LQIQRPRCTPLRGPQSKSGVKSIGFESKKQDAKKRIQKFLHDHKARSKMQEAKCQQQM